MYEFEMVRPASLDEAVKALSGEDVQPLAGGQTLIPALKSRLAAPERLVSLSGIDALRGMRREGDELVIGAGTTHRDVAEGATRDYPALARLAGNIGDPAVRNRGTIGGSLANNDPSSCYPSAALASGAVIVTNTRRIGADDYFQGMFTTALDEDELITEVRLPIPAAARYEKFEQPASRFALVGVFVARFAGGVRVAVTGASEEGVFRWAEAEAALSRRFDADAVQGLSLPAEGMIEDIHGTPAYRAHLAGVLTRRAVAAAG